MLAASAVVALAVQPWLPQVAQEQAFHHFADRRALWGLPNALDTVSNAGFVLGGCVGIALICGGRQRANGSVPFLMALLTFFGLALTGVCSAWYHGHARPNDAGLVVDRCGMVVAFAGISGWAAATQVSSRGGWLLTGALLLAGPASIAWWRHTGNLTPYATLQALGMLILVLSALGRDPRSMEPSWGAVAGLYALAKLTESADVRVWEWTLHSISGHTLKHLVAACAALPLIAALCPKTNQGPQSSERCETAKTAGGR